MSLYYNVYDVQGGPKKVSQCILHITSSNAVRFSKFFHCHILLEICNKTVVKYPTSPQTCCHITLWNTYVSKLVRPQSVKCVTSLRFTKLKYNEYFQSMLMVRQLAYHSALKMLPATHQDSGEFIFQQDSHSSQNTLVLLRKYFTRYFTV